jgi:hypothetical protein
LVPRGFLFPLSIWVIGWAFERGHPPDAEALEHALVHLKTLVAVIYTLLIAHVLGGVVGILYWQRLSVLLTTAVQVGCSLVASFLALMAVQGEWL